MLLKIGPEISFLKIFFRLTEKQQSLIPDCVDPRADNQCPLTSDDKCEILSLVGIHLDRTLFRSCKRQVTMILSLSSRNKIYWSTIVNSGYWK